MRNFGRTILIKVAIGFATFFFGAIFNAGAEAAFLVDDSLKCRMEQERVAFLESLPLGLQDSQAEAVNAAIGGDNRALDAVRNSRNSRPELPAEIEVVEISPEIRMFRRVALADSVLPALVYLHGGGWCFGSINSCSRYCAALAMEADIAVVALDYPLAPEHPYPSALVFCLESFDRIKNEASRLKIDTGQISVGGDSAGGNLALAMALAGVVRYGRSDINSLVLFYPVTYCGNDGSDSWRGYGRGYGLDAALMDSFNAAYLSGGAELENPLVSPLCASDSQLAALPPLLMVSAEKDILLDQGVEFANRATAAGARVERVVIPSTVHLFITVAGQSAAFSTAVDLTADFLTGLPM